MSVTTCTDVLVSSSSAPKKLAMVSTQKKIATTMVKERRDELAAVERSGATVAWTVPMARDAMVKSSVSRNYHRERWREGCRKAACDEEHCGLRSKE